MESEVDLARFRGLNMNHGFMRAIVKNQIDRDEYHKVMEERRAEVQQRIRQSRRRSTKKKDDAADDAPLYVPPHRRREHVQPSAAKVAERSNLGPAVISNVEESTLREKVRNRVRAKLDDLDTLLPSSSAESEKKQESKPLFMLNLKNHEGKDVEVAVMSTDSAARLAKELSRKYGFTDDQCRMLRLTLDRELERRLAVS